MYEEVPPLDPPPGFRPVDSPQPELPPLDTPQSRELLLMASALTHGHFVSLPFEIILNIYHTSTYSRPLYDRIPVVGSHRTVQRKSVLLKCTAD